MVLDPKSRTLHLKFVTGGVTADSATYGTQNYGDQTYGQEAGESTLTGIRYALVPVGGWNPLSAMWRFRSRDTMKLFQAQIVDYEDPIHPIELDAVAAAMLYLRPVDLGRPGVPLEFPLTLDLVNDVLEREWEPDDLSITGRYSVVVHIEFETTRRMTVETDDESLLQVTDGTDEQQIP
jgi:hypothetical protein